MLPTQSQVTSQASSGRVRKLVTAFTLAFLVAVQSKGATPTAVNQLPAPPQATFPVDSPTRYLFSSISSAFGFSDHI